MLDRRAVRARLRGDARIAPRANPEEQVHVHLLHDASLPGADVESLGALVRAAGGQFAAIDVPYDRRGVWPDSGRFQANAWYRVRLPELLPDVDRVLYIDADALITANLRELWSSELRGWPLGAVTQYFYPAMIPRIEADLRLPDVTSYFNSGVLLFDLDRWQLRGYGSDRGVRANPLGQMVWPDQDALNGVLHARRHRLHPRWNAMTGIWELPLRQLPYPRDQVREARRDPAIVHFIGPFKPWHLRCKSRYRAEWFEYLHRTPWRARAVEGRSVRHAVFKPLPTVWAYNIEAAIDRERAKLAARRR